MAWIPSHQEIGDHPKTLRFARRLGVSIPTAVGHLHLLWHWTLTHAPDGDLSKFDAEDIAIGAKWEGDPDPFVDALVSCGPGTAAGFMGADRQLHDWSEHGGRYGRRVAAAKKAAAARWNTADGCDGNANAVQTQCDDDAQRNAEERRGEEKEISAPAALVSVPTATDLAFDAFWAVYPRKIDQKQTKVRYTAAIKAHGQETVDAGCTRWAAYWRNDRTEERLIPHPTTWLGKERFLAQPPRARGQRAPVQTSHTGAQMAPGVEF